MLPQIDLLPAFHRRPAFALGIEYLAWRHRRRLTPSSRFRRMVAVYECWFEYAPHMMPGM